MAEPEPFYVIANAHLAGAYEVLKQAMTLYRLYPTQLAQQHCHTALAHYELLTLQAHAERFVSVGLGEPQRPQQWDWLADAADAARALPEETEPEL